MARTEIKIGGFGGQGVILAGTIIGKAASLFDAKHATMIQSFGPEARGSTCSSQLIVADEEIMYPYIRKPNILMAFSHDAYATFEPEMAPDAMLLIESDLVKPKAARGSARSYGIPATKIAEEIGKRMVTNIVMVGFFAAVSGLVSADAVRKAVLDTIPKGTEELNLRAFERGYDEGRRLLATGK
ncbi:MAG: pyruvate ferredoxin oxidoreductase [Planctomycetes bacterium RBG_16_59_8]|nr:MAG: pyruvate ferredoxin oxidoreductase [Planctomycetes bacterium RBG_16_59_8]